MEVVLQRPEIFQVVEEEYDAHPGVELSFQAIAAGAEDARKRARARGRRA